MVHEINNQQTELSNLSREPKHCDYQQLNTNVARAPGITDSII